MKTIRSTVQTKLNQSSKQGIVAFLNSALIAIGMFCFEVQKTSTINLTEGEGIGHFILLFGLSSGGLALFYLGGSLWSTKTGAAVTIFIMSIGLRTFFGFYIEILEVEGVFESSERWTMHAGNVFLLCVELAFAFTQTRSRRLISMSEQIKEAESALVLEKEKFNELDSKTKKLSNEFEQKAFELSKRNSRLEKDFKLLLDDNGKLESNLNEASSNLELASKGVEELSKKVEKMETPFQIGLKLAGKFISMNGNVYLFGCPSCGAISTMGRTSNQVECACGSTHVKTDRNVITKNSTILV